MGDLSSVSFSSGLSRHKAGRQDVSFASDGRVIHGATESLPGTSYPPGRRQVHYYEDDRYSYDPYREQLRQQRRYQAQTLDLPRQRDNLGYQHSPRSESQEGFMRNYDRGYIRDYGHNYGRDYDPGHFLHSRRHHNDAPLPTRKKRQPERLCSKRSPFGFVFVIIAILILVCAIVNLLLCFDYHYFCGFWVCVMLLEFGCIGVYHRGNYKSHCRNWSYIIFGIIAGVLVFVGTALVFDKLLPDFIFLSENSTETYITFQKAIRTPIIIGSVTDSERAWVCLSMDCSLVILFILGYFSFLAVCLVTSKFHDSSFKVTGKVEPWCSPVWFNPYGQVPLGNFITFLGILVRYLCVAGPNDTSWYEFWAPVWAGAMLVIGGFLSALSMKRPDLKSKTGFTLFIQFLSIAAAIAAFIIQILGIVDNATEIERMSEDPKSSGSHSFEQYLTSVVIYCIAAFFLLFAIIYTVSLLIRLVFIMCYGNQEHYQRENRSATESSSSFDPSVSSFTGFTRRDPTRGYKYGANWQRY